MKTCKCEHWAVCPICKPEWFDRWGNRLPPEPTPLQKANGRIEELEQQLAEAQALIEEKEYQRQNLMEALQRQGDSAQEEINRLRKQLSEHAAEIARLKTVPMKYRRMAFNAQLQDENAKLSQQLQEVCNAIGSPEYMDPPDGGSVTIAEQVSRMREDRDQLRQQLEKIQEHCRDYAAQAETDAGIIKADGKEIHFLRQQFAFATQERNGYREAQDLACEERDELLQQVTLLLELANKCRIELVVQIHELADHIERARGCITDQDMLNQINGQRDYALKVSDNWNQNGNPFESLSATKEQ